MVPAAAFSHRGLYCFLWYPLTSQIPYSCAAVAASIARLRPPIAQRRAAAAGSGYHRHRRLQQSCAIAAAGFPSANYPRKAVPPLLPPVSASNRSRRATPLPPLLFTATAHARSLNPLPVSGARQWYGSLLSVLESAFLSRHWSFLTLRVHVSLFRSVISFCSSTIYVYHAIARRLLRAHQDFCQSPLRDPVSWTLRRCKNLLHTEAVVDGVWLPIYTYHSTESLQFVPPVRAGLWPDA